MLSGREMLSNLWLLLVQCALVYVWLRVFILWDFIMLGKMENVWKRDSLLILTRCFSIKAEDIQARTERAERRFRCRITVIEYCTSPCKYSYTNTSVRVRRPMQLSTSLSLFTCPDVKCAGAITRRGLMVLLNIFSPLVHAFLWLELQEYMRAVAISRHHEHAGRIHPTEHDVWEKSHLHNFPFGAVDHPTQRKI